MDNQSAESLLSIIHRLKPLHDSLAEVAEEVHGGMWAVLLEAGRLGPATVPEIARSRRVSRQHVQVCVNELLERGLVRLAPNPRHKRSSLVHLTASGRSEVDSIRSREQRLAALVELDISPMELSVAAGVLDRLAEYFSSTRWRLLAEHSRANQSE